AWVRDVLLKNAEELRSLYFTGGEPMIEKQVEHIIDELIRRGAAGNVRLEFNTNCTVIRDSMLEKLTRFKSIHLGLSLAGYGPYLEYIRFPAKWDVVRRNVEKLAALAAGKSHWTVSAVPVLQCYNALNVVHLLEFLDGVKIPYHVGFALLPKFLNVS